jgi:hypothetical protein
VAANTVHVGLRPGASFPFIGGGSPVITIGATYTRNPALGVATSNTNNVVIGFQQPVYQLSLNSVPPNPLNIPANGSQSSLITASLFRLTTLTPGLCQTVLGTVICPVAGNTAYTAGVEPGVVTFQTNSGYFGAASAVPGSSGQQIYSTHCGTVPGVAPLVLIPAVGQTFTFSLNQCTTATAQLLGGGSVGMATVVATFTGDVTGATVQGATNVQITPAPATQPLTRGCSQVITPASTPVGASIASIASLVTPNSAVVSIWVFNNATHSFQAGFFGAAGAPTDVSSTGPGLSLFVCVSSGATFPTTPY